MEYTKQNFKSGQILTAEALNNMDSSLESAVNELNNKQEKITDGSIPLSALSDDVKDKLNNIFITPEDFVEEEYNEPDEEGFLGKVKQVYVTDILENRYNKINISGVLGDINITDGLINITIKYEVFQSEQKQESYTETFIRVQDCKFKQVVYLNTSPFVTPLFSGTATDINGDIRYNFVKSVTDEEITIPEENKQLFKKNMGSFANWNAQEGEAGYIENKPFYDNISNIESIDFTRNSKYYFYHNSLSGTMSLPKDRYLMYNELLAGTHTGEKNIVKVSNLQVGEYLYVRDPEGIYDVVYEVVYTDPEGSNIQISCSSNGPSIIQINELYNFQVCDFNTITLNEKFIPNTIVKTTPQSLSDTEKNQVKQNIGIETPATPDWNQNDAKAKDYIKNRPFYSFINIPFAELNAEESDQHRIEVSIDTEDGFCIRTPYWVIGPFNDMDEQSYEGLYTPYGNITSIYRDDTIFNLYTDAEITIPIIEWLNENAYIGYNTNNEDLVKHIPDIYISDTVLKTTPQTLSDADKNQALANLGIDPVVWKYMCEPFVIPYGDEDNGEIPYDLQNIILDTNNNLKPIALKLIVAAYSGIIESLSHIESGNKLSTMSGDLININDRSWDKV